MANSLLWWQQWRFAFHVEHCCSIHLGWGLGNWTTPFFSLLTSAGTMQSGNTGSITTLWHTENKLHLRMPSRPIYSCGLHRWRITLTSNSSYKLTVTSPAATCQLHWRNSIKEITDTRTFLVYATVNFVGANKQSTQWRRRVQSELFWYHQLPEITRKL